MNIKINGKDKEVKENITIMELLKSLNYSNWVGVWVNDNQLLQKEYEHYIIKDNDEIRIIRPLGGG